jgi:hypothetical protein
VLGPIPVEPRAFVLSKVRSFCTKSEFETPNVYSRLFFYGRITIRTSVMEKLVRIHVEGPADERTSGICEI